MIITGNCLREICLMNQCHLILLNNQDTNGDLTELSGALNNWRRRVSEKTPDLMNDGPEEIIEFFEQHFVEQACAIADKQITVPIDRNLFKQALRDKFK